MLVVTTVTYRFTINGVHTKVLKSNRGLRQGDPMSLVLCGIVMEYLHRTLQNLKRIPDFNFNSKCEKFHVINLIFVDGLLIFSRGDTRSIELLMKAFNDFSAALRLIVNPTKCKAYYGGMKDNIKEQIQALTSFREAPLPFRYLEIPMTRKNLYSQHCIILVENIVLRIKHQSARLHCYAGRLQLIRSVLFATTN